MNADLEKALLFDATRNSNRFIAKWVLASVVASLLTGVLSYFVANQLLMQRYETRIRELNARMTATKYALSPETMNRHREISRLLMYAQKNGQIKGLPSQAFQGWLSVAEVSTEENGLRRYQWINYTAKTDHRSDRDGGPAGAAWLIMDDNDRVQDVGYISYEY